MQAQAEMPRYRSHKVVHALKIERVFEHSDDSATIIPSDSTFATFKTRSGWVKRFNGSDEDMGYYVVYPDGFTSWSPTDAFESGYSRI